MDIRLLVHPTPGYAPTIGQLVSMLDYTRAATLNDIAGLSVADLDHRLDVRANSIGVILEHIAAVEATYQLRSFGWTLEGEAAKRHQLALRINEESWETFRGNELGVYLDRLSIMREKTLAELTRKDDAWLFEVHDQRGRDTNNYWRWFHVIEEEISHRGQIRVLRKRLPEG